MSLSARVLHEECVLRGLRDEWRLLCKAALDAYHQEVRIGAVKTSSLAPRSVNNNFIARFEQARTMLSSRLHIDLQGIDMYSVYDEWRQSSEE